MEQQAIPLDLPTRGLTIAVVGGLDRTAPELKHIAASLGHSLEHHVGTSSGPGKRSLDAMIGRADVVVIVTGRNNHPAVLFARERARDHRVPSLICRRFGPSNLTRLLDAVARRDADHSTRRAGP